MPDAKIQEYDKEIYDLHKLIASCPIAKTSEMDEVLNLLEKIYEAGVVTPDEHNELMDTLNVLLENPNKLRSMRAAMFELSHPRAAEKIASALIDLAGE